MGCMKFHASHILYKEKIKKFLGYFFIAFFRGKKQKNHKKGLKKGGAWFTMESSGEKW
ncbi:Uncharacterised protein [uncultured Clostridium sp.]|nr:Uncharacterised protein [uncultured Clostridium sp.]